MGLWTPTNACRQLPGPPGQPPVYAGPSTLSTVFLVLAGLSMIGTVWSIFVLLSLGAVLRTTRRLLPLVLALCINVLGFVLYVRHQRRCHPWTGFALFVLSWFLMGWALQTATLVMASESLLGGPPPPPPPPRPEATEDQVESP